MSLSGSQHKWLTLTSIPGVGTAQFFRLLARFHTPENILSAPVLELSEIMGKALAQRISQCSEVVDLKQQLRLMNEYQVHLTTLHAPDYPLRLAEIYDPHLALFCRSELHQCDQFSITLVDTLRATPHEIRMAEKFAREFTNRGITVISGMAAGIDTEAHRGALDAGGRTIAVLGCGVNVVYHKSNPKLINDIIQQGCVLSQSLMDSPPARTHFPVRNRIISGMSMGTVVVQAQIKYGALITAHTALEQGRKVFAIPGEIGIHNSANPHSLIRDGAKLIETADDILDELNVSDELHVSAVKLPEASPAPIPPEANDIPNLPPMPKAYESVSNDVDKDILSVLKPNCSYVDEIAAACRNSVEKALSTLSILELKGTIRQFSGKKFAPR
jgi:DNA processing protein